MPKSEKPELTEELVDKITALIESSGLDYIFCLRKPFVKEKAGDVSFGYCGWRLGDNDVAGFKECLQQIVTTYYHRLVEGEMDEELEQRAHEVLERLAEELVGVVFQLRNDDLIATVENTLQEIDSVCAQSDRKGGSDDEGIPPIH